MPNLYEILGLSMDASQEEVTQAFDIFFINFARNISKKIVLKSLLTRQARQRYGDNQFNATVQAATNFSKDTAEIIREYYDEAALIGNQLNLLAKNFQDKKLGILSKIRKHLLNPRRRYQYDIFVLGLEHSVGEPMPSQFFKRGGIFFKPLTWSYIIRRQTITVKTPFGIAYVRYEPNEEMLSLYGLTDNILENPAIFLSAPCAPQEDPYESESITRLMEHPNYPISNRDLLPLEGLSDDLPTIVLLEPSAILGFIQQCKQAWSQQFNAALFHRHQDRNVQGLLRLEEQLLKRDHHLTTPIPFEQLRSEVFKRTCKTLTPCVEGQRHAMIRNLANTWFFRSRTKKRAQDYLQKLQELTQHLEGLTTPNLNEEQCSKTVENIITDIKDLKKFPQAKGLLADILRHLSPEQSLAIQTSIGSFSEGDVCTRKALLQIFNKEIVQLIEDYIEEPSTHGLW